MWIAGNGKKMEDISLCFRYFEQFQKDFPALYDKDKGVIKRIAFDHYEWTDSETSLAEYFMWIGNDADNVPGGFWNPVETVFKVKGQTLSNMASRAKNSISGETKKFKRIKKIVEEYREKEEQKQKDMETFTAIKTLVYKADGGGMEEIRAALEKIKVAIK